MKGVSIWRPGAVIRPGRVDAMPIGQPPERVTVIEGDAARSRTLVEYLTDRVSIFYAGIDGVRWDLFAADPAMADAIYQNAIAQPGFQVRMTDLETLARYMDYGDSPR